LTTGTGSGKSLAYIIPIVDKVLKSGAGQGIKAVIVYPMNALANSQIQELEKYLGKENQKVTFQRYTGQEDRKRRDEIIANPPDILITNYVMLELILTRPEEKKIVEAAHGLKFLVFDELHTYRGRQGADVAMLIRRAKEYFNTKDLQCVGTSATMSSDGSIQQQKKQVADVASLLFGVPFAEDDIIGETLTRNTIEKDYSDPSVKSEIIKIINDDHYQFPKQFDQFKENPFASWLETVFGIHPDEQSGILVRNTPIPITGKNGADQQLSDLTGLDKGVCKPAIIRGLLAGSVCEPNPDTGFVPFAFRLHQFISKGDTVYTSLENEEDRYITTRGQKFVPGNRDKLLFPVAFCRECGHTYHTVWRKRDESGREQIIPRAFNELLSDDDQDISGYLYVNEDHPWPDDMDEIIETLPDDWLENRNGNIRVLRNRLDDLPQRVSLNTKGEVGEPGLTAWFIKSHFKFCPNCGVSYGIRQRSDIQKLGTLGTEGRSTATTVLALSAIRQLKNFSEISEKAKKLLSFTDNRQDASLQAGHFNDFVEIGLLRAGLYKAVANAKHGITHEEIPHAVYDALGLTLEDFANNPNVKYQQKENTIKALKQVIGYRLFRDLKRGWRIVAPNLEQVGLLKIEYQSLSELCHDEENWTDVHQALVEAKPEIRYQICRTLLDFLRRELALDVGYLRPDIQQRIQHQSDQYLIEPWALEENEEATMEQAASAIPDSKSPSDYGGNVYLSGRSGFGSYLGRNSTFPDYSPHLKLDERQSIIRSILDKLEIAGLVTAINEIRDGIKEYQVPASAMIWKAGDGSEPFHDPIRVPRRPEQGSVVNEFFKEFYTTVAYHLHGYEAREHTAQVESEERERREELFREGNLPILFCSPTMELGIDIASLNVVNMRNVPPTPANYAQRSGRAGRSGQPALIFTYCSSGNNHDQYFFRRPDRMVAGSVLPPRIDLGNEDLIRSHVHAVWLTETGVSLHESVSQLLDLTGENASLELIPSIKDDFHKSVYRERTIQRSNHIFESIKTILDDTEWYYDGWLKDEMITVLQKFEDACERWRNLYRSAVNQSIEAGRIIRDASRSYRDKESAKRLRSDAERQLELLTNIKMITQSDFYSYRYFASEGFLPGYNFPRLPLSAYIPGSRNRRKHKYDQEYLSRPRFLAISEFGPRAVVYHEGAKYIINKVIMPVDEDSSINTSSIKRCSNCGYVYPITDSSGGKDVCEQCHHQLEVPINPLFRMENVQTRKRARINSDEEERLRYGYDIISGIQFGQKRGSLHMQRAELRLGDKVIAVLKYGPAAEIWRINMGWARRKSEDPPGFVLDLESGTWANNKRNPDDPNDPLSDKTARVIPFVKDKKNCLIFESSEVRDRNTLITLMAALKNTIQIRYQLEDRELAAEVLPDDTNPNSILLYEASEGGAGALRKILESSGGTEEIQELMSEALRLCHFDPETGEDLGKAPDADEKCEAACYDCLLSYFNQRYHLDIDRKLIQPFLMDAKQAVLKTSPGSNKRDVHFENLVKLVESDLERRWLTFIMDHNLHLPSMAQYYIEKCKTRPDFYYDNEKVAVYIDGPPHDYPERQERDKTQETDLLDFGIRVIRFHHQDNWQEIVNKYSTVFGKLA